MSLPKDITLAKCKDLKSLCVVRVEWHDARSSGGWSNINDYRGRRPLWAESTGYLTAHDKKSVQVAQSICENQTLTDTITIPRKWIKSISVIWKRSKRS